MNNHDNANVSGRLRIDWVFPIFFASPCRAAKPRGLDFRQGHGLSTRCLARQAKKFHQIFTPSASFQCRQKSLRKYNQNDVFPAKKRQFLSRITPPLAHPHFSQQSLQKITK
ncbi:hypothetical protein [Burkholderia sp. Ac-20349]|uniref:hypothetical protein n=1 Tax=Burkholderia sp. Ac-20349 TaxID=2703893 RepID=UPI00197CB016|nr:hypothetical protein [Burkholderia sp. Ac-20349]MBN3838172.1 hypothetical protein [Burkholderia sp. Ac-20349]